MDIQLYLDPHSKKHQAALQYIKNLNKKKKPNERPIKNSGTMQIIQDKEALEAIENLREELLELLVRKNHNNKVIRVIQEELNSRGKPELVQLQQEITQLKTSSLKPPENSTPHLIAQLRIKKNKLLEVVQGQTEDIQLKTEILDSIKNKPIPEESKKLKALRKKLQELKEFEAGNFSEPPPRQIVASSTDTWQNYPSQIREQLSTNHLLIKAKQERVAELEQELEDCADSPVIKATVEHQIKETHTALLAGFEKRFTRETNSVSAVYDYEINELSGKLTDLQQQVQVRLLSKLQSTH